MEPGVEPPRVYRPVPSVVVLSFAGSARPAPHTISTVPVLASRKGSFSLVVTVSVLPSALAETPLWIWEP